MASKKEKERERELPAIQQHQQHSFFFFHYFNHILHNFILIAKQLTDIVIRGIIIALTSLKWVLYQRHFEKRRLCKAKNSAKNFELWANSAVELDGILGNNEWKSNPKSRDYDYGLISDRLHLLRNIANGGDVLLMMFHIRAGLIRNFGGIANPKLYESCNYGTKRLIEEYVQEIAEQLEYIYQIDETNLSLQKKSEFFFSCHQTYGRTALILDGSAGFSLIQLGIVKALFEQSLLPKVICGTAAGALVAALVCSKTDEELPLLFKPGGIDFSAFQKRSETGKWKRRAKRFLKHRVMMDVRILEKCLQDNIGNLTFEEAYRKTGRILNITLSYRGNHETPRLLNHLIAPNVVIWSAACASCSVVGLYENVDLLAKNVAHPKQFLSNNVIDPSKNLCPIASQSDDLFDMSNKTIDPLVKWNPEGIKWTASQSQLKMTRLSELFFVNHFIVSQAFPLTMMLTPKRRYGTLGAIQNFIFSEVDHRMKQLEEFHLLPSILAAFLQTQKGDINITAKYRFSDVLSMFNSPRDDVVQTSILRGEQATWPHLASLKTRFVIERQLESINERIENDRQALQILLKEEEIQKALAANRLGRRKSYHV